MKITPIQKIIHGNLAEQAFNGNARLDSPFLFISRKKTCNNRPEESWVLARARLTVNPADRLVERARARASMPHEVMNASRQTHNESDIPEIRVKTAYNGQVHWFDKMPESMTDCAFLLIIFEFE